MPSFFDQIPDAETLEEFEPEELAANILFYLLNTDINELTGGRDIFHYGGIFQIPREREDLQPRRKEIERCLLEAWTWLENQGLLVPEPGTNGQNGYRFISRKARNIGDIQSFREYVHSQFFPKDVLHRKIRDRVWSAFVRGEYDTAVFQAMKAVETSVRDSAGFGRSRTGVPLMRDAFHKDNGPLTDPSLESAEKESLGHLFAGAYGYFRNPNAHHEVAFDSPEEAMEIVLLANHLLRIVDAANERNNSDGEEE